MIEKYTKLKSREKNHLYIYEFYGNFLMYTIVYRDSASKLSRQALKGAYLKPPMSLWLIGGFLLPR
jgi:hypothetical protein